ncbi:uncharacterized protein LOC114680373 isoform X4 [Macaca mulatta]
MIYIPGKNGAASHSAAGCQWCKQSATRPFPEGLRRPTQRPLPLPYPSPPRSPTKAPTFQTLAGPRQHPFSLRPWRSQAVLRARKEGGYDRDVGSSLGCAFSLGSQAGGRGITEASVFPRPRAAGRASLPACDVPTCARPTSRAMSWSDWWAPGTRLPHGHWSRRTGPCVFPTCTARKLSGGSHFWSLPETIHQYEVNSRRRSPAMVAEPQVFQCPHSGLFPSGSRGKCHGSLLCQGLPAQILRSRQSINNQLQQKNLKNNYKE